MRTDNPVLDELRKEQGENGEDAFVVFVFLLVWMTLCAFAAAAVGGVYLTVKEVASGKTA